MGEMRLLKIEQTVLLREKTLVIIDRRRFPHEIVEIVCADYEQVARCIEDMAVQGAGDIALTAGYGLLLAAWQIETRPDSSAVEVREHLERARQRLIATRPTGFHITALLKKIMAGMDWNSYPWSEQILNQLSSIISKQEVRSDETGRRAEGLLVNGDTILTHCFPGPGLLFMLQHALENGKKISVIATETRPYLQGARLTAWAVSELGIPVTLITDNMAAYCMSQGMISKVFTAADRIAMDGTVANKVGTFQLALAAHYHKIPFYILGYGGPDQNCPTGSAIPIEMRNPEEVLNFNGIRITGEKVKAIYPAFDLTPPDLIAGVVTDRGILSPTEVGSYWSLPVCRV
ncbi:MAG: s-methyl-5-thioribose-1-phosphate isomerase [Syntrophomonadaceae bacterium]